MRNVPQQLALVDAALCSVVETVVSPAAPSNLSNSMLLHLRAHLHRKTDTTTTTQTWTPYQVESLSKMFCTVYETVTIRAPVRLLWN